MPLLDSRMQLSVIVPVGIRHSEIAALYSEYHDAVARTGLRSEFIFVLDGRFAEPESKVESGFQTFEVLPVTRPSNRQQHMSRAKLAHSSKLFPKTKNE